MASSGEKRKIELDLSKEPESKRQKLDTGSSSEDSETTVDESTNGEARRGRKKRRINRQPNADVVMVSFKGLPRDAIDEMLEDINDDIQKSDFKDARIVIIPNERIRVFPSEEENRKERKEYRRIYNRDPTNVEKRRAKSQTPEEIEKRKKNNENEETKERKKLCAAARRKILAEFREENPEKYDKMKQKHIPSLPPKPKKPREKKEKPTPKISIKLVEPRPQEGIVV